MIKTILILSLALSSNLFAMQPPQAPELNTYQYWVRIPQTNRTCAEEANIMGDRFAQATRANGSVVTEKICRSVVTAPYDGAKNSLYSILITYKATREAWAYSALFGSMDFQSTPANTNGIYAKYSDCVAGLDAQATHYETETGLVAVAAFCQPSLMGDTYTITVQGFGEPKRRLYVMKSAMTGEVNPELSQSMDHFLAGLDAHVVFRTETHYFYYRENYLELRQNMFGDFSNPAECAAQVATVSNIYTLGKSKQQIVACLPWGKKMALNGLADGVMLSYFSGDAVYYSFDECMQDRSRVMQANTGYYSNPLGAICKEDYHAAGQYVMELYR